jgi:hypothetical protein
MVGQRADAAKWVADYQAFEDGLIHDGKNVDDEAVYAPFYASHGRVLKTNDFFLSDETILGGHNTGTILIAYVVGITGSVVIVRVGVKRLIRGSATRRQPSR